MTKQTKKNNAAQSSGFYHKESAWAGVDAKKKKRIHLMSESYKQFLGLAKTERECVNYFVDQLKRYAFKPITQCRRLQSGDKVFKVIKHRALITAVIGNPNKTWRIVGSHIDSPRLDLKPNPLYQDADLAVLKTHYYGGIKKYHWVNVPLSMHAVVHTKKGKQEFIIGEKPGEPNFIIPDIAPHIANEQMNKVTKKAIEGEQLRIVMGNQPLPQSRENEKVKAAVLDLLHQRYGIVERDLLTADITFVPAAKPVDIGLDHAMIAGYGQDDRICAYAQLMALIHTRQPKGVAVGLFIDKEEIGSTGDTGAQSRILENFVDELRTKTKVKVSSATIMEKATAISADVTEALNPNFKDVSDEGNTSILGGGVSIEKYGGAGGKYETNDASSEYMSWLTQALDQAGICWQTGEVGKLDTGGGGTIAMFLSRYGMDAIDAGPPLLSMHAAQELSSKIDFYEAQRCYQLFMNL
jgi:aspartyl aminopeptidase